MRRSVFFTNNNSLRDLIYSSLSFSTIHWMRLTEPPLYYTPRVYNIRGSSKTTRFNDTSQVRSAQV